MSTREVDAEPARNGWAVVPRRHTRALKDIETNEHNILGFNSVKMLSSKVTETVFEYAETVFAYTETALPAKTSNPSMQVWNYGVRYQLCFSLAMAYLDSYGKVAFYHGPDLTVFRQHHHLDAFSASYAYAGDLLLDLCLTRHGHDSGAHEGYSSTVRVMGHCQSRNIPERMLSTKLAFAPLS